MDLATILGILGAFGIVLYSMVLGGDLMLFVNLPSALIVIHGPHEVWPGPVSGCSESGCQSV